MKSLSSLDFSKTDASRFRWIPLDIGRFELRDAKDCFATLEWPHVSGAHAHGRVAEGGWDIRRLSLFGPYIRIATLAGGAEVAHFGKASLDDPAQVKFRDDSIYLWRPLVTVEGMSFETPEGKPVVDFRPRLVSEQHFTNVSVYQWVDHLPQLLLLGWYILEMEYREDTNLNEDEISYNA